MPPNPEFTPTPEQQAIVEQASAKHGSLLIEAGAGCAKSSTLELASAKIKVPALALAFNKRIADGMKTRLSPQFTVKTLNGLGHGAWARALGPMVELKLDDRKYGRLTSQVAKEWKWELSTDQWDSTRRLVTGAMTQGLVPQSQDYLSLVEDSFEGWGDVGDGIGLLPDESKELWELAREVLVRGVEQARQGLIAFDDQVYCSVMLGGKFPQFPVVFVDEDQDLSPLQVRMVSSALRSDGRLFAVGDRRQGIYGFRGASGQAAQLLQGLRPAAEWTEFPLMTTFRCPQTVVARQQGHVPGFRAWHTNPAGQIHQWRSPEPQGGLEWESWSWQKLQSSRPQGGSLAVLCRNNGPLLSMAFKLLRQGIGCHMLGRDIGKGLIALSRRLAPEDQTPGDAFRGLLDDWEREEISKLKANDRPERVAGVVDRAECLRAVLDSGGARDAGALRALLGRLFEQTTGLVTLSSVHRAKGLEWDCVVHLDPWRVPSRQARQQAAAGRPEALGQELNLKYVCETRTKHTLVLASLDDFH